MESGFVSYEWPDEWGRPGPDWVRDGGPYAEWRGVWFPSSLSGRGGTLALYARRAKLDELDWVRQAMPPIGGLIVPVGEITRLISTRSFVVYLGHRARLIGTRLPDGLRDGWVEQFSPGGSAVLEFAGDDYEWAAALPGFEARDVWHPYGYGVGGEVPLSEVSEFTQEITEYPVGPAA